MTGHIDVIGLGPGAPEQMTYQVAAIIERATDFIGYTPYLNRITSNIRARRHGSDNRREINRGQLAIDLAMKGRRVVVVSGGDPGVFGMASALFEVVAQCPEQLRNQLDIHVFPGVSAVLACAARIGAPLGGDFCVMSLSDNLKPWDVIVKRLRHAAEAGFVIALYNPRSKARPYQLEEAFKLLSTLLPAQTPVVCVKSASRDGEDVKATDLMHADPKWVDMRTLVLIGSHQSHYIGTSSDPKKWLYTMRKVDSKT